MTIAPKSVQAKDVATLIAACAKSGVTSLKWRDLEVSFGSQGQPATAYDLQKPGYDGYAPQASEQELTRDPSLQTVDTELLEDMRRAQLMIDDPVSFEQEVIDAHLRQPAHGNEN